MRPRDGIALHRIDLPGRGTASVYEAGLGYRGDAPTLALLHGSPGASLCSWMPSITRLSTAFHVVAMDMRGHGRGIRPQGGFGATPFSLEDCADDLAEGLAALGIPSAIVVGYSLGDWLKTQTG